MLARRDSIAKWKKRLKLFQEYKVSELEEKSIRKIKLKKKNNSQHIVLSNRDQFDDCILVCELKN